MGLAGRQAYDTIVLDYWLPDQSGPAIIRSIRAAAKDANLVVVTGDPAPEREREAMAGGADGFWRKSTGSFDEFFRGLYQRRGHAPS